MEIIDMQINSYLDEIYNLIIDGKIIIMKIIYKEKTPGELP